MKRIKCLNALHLKLLMAALMVLDHLHKDDTTVNTLVWKLPIRGAE